MVYKWEKRERDRDFSSFGHFWFEVSEVTRVRREERKQGAAVL